MPDPPPRDSPPPEPPGEDPPTPPPPPPDDEAERLLDEAFKLGEGDEAWLEIARRASRPAEPLGNLGPYTLLEEIGRGGQGEVYKAVQPGTGRNVALKRLAAGGLRIGSRAAERFSREVDAATRLSHPNVVTVFAAEVIDGHAVLVMEYVDGTTIDRWADACWADPASGDREKRSRVLRAFAAACDGVAHAHQRGVIHRDLKPSNIMIGPDDVPRVLDFGVAKVLEEWRERDPSGARATAWTATGFAGTPAYAPPEQLHEGGRSVDTRADVYALGVILYRLLSGEEAFGNRQGLADLLDAVRRGPERRPSQARPSVGREADWIVRRAMDPDAARRYQTVDALAEDVRRLLDGRAVLAHPPSAAYTAWRAVRRRPRTWGAAILAAAAITALSVVASVQAARLGKRTDDLAAALHTANEQRERAERGEARQHAMNVRLLQAVMGASNDDRFIYTSDADPLSVLMSISAQLGPEDTDETVAEVHMRLGTALARARRWADAEPVLATAQQASDRADDPWSERALRIAMRLVSTLRGLKRHEEALTVADRAIARAQTGETSPYLANVYWERVYTLAEMETPLPEFRAACDVMIAAADMFPDRVAERASMREEAARFLVIRDQPAAAEALLREALDIARRTNVERPVGANAISRFNHALAFALVRLGRWADAEEPAKLSADYRLRHETAHGGRGHRFVVVHAEVLHRLGRYSEAAPRWELAIIRPLSYAQPDQRLLARLRLRLAAARYGAGDVLAGRATLAQALSLGRSINPDHPDVREIIDGVEISLRASNWQVNESAMHSLGDRAWMAEALLEPSFRVPIAPIIDQAR